MRLLRFNFSVSLVLFEWVIHSITLFVPPSPKKKFECSCDDENQKRIGKEEKKTISRRHAILTVRVLIISQEREVVDAMNCSHCVFFSKDSFFFSSECGNSLLSVKKEVVFFLFFGVPSDARHVDNILARYPHFFFSEGSFVRTSKKKSAHTHTHTHTHILHINNLYDDFELRRRPRRLKWRYPRSR